MWSIESPSSGTTNKVIIPTDGIVSIVAPKGVKVSAFVNDAPQPMHHIHVKAGDVVHFGLKGNVDVPTSVAFKYGEDTSYITVAPSKSKKSSTNPGTEGNIMTPADTVNLFANPTGGAGGAMGAGLGAGLLGGVLGGALLGGGGGLLGGNRAAAGDVNLNTENAIAASERLTNARFDALAQAAIESSIERTAAANLLAVAVGNAALGVEVAKGQGEINVQNALNAAALGVQVQKTAGDTQVMLSLQAAALGVQNEKTAAANSLANTNEHRDTQASIFQGQAAAALLAAENKYQLANAISHEGERTRALIIAQNDAELNRMLVTAQNQIIEMRGDRNGDIRSRATEVNMTQIVNQNQQQQQQQQQFDTTTRLLSAILNQAQIAQATNQNLIIGNTAATTTGAQSANPINVR